MSKSTMGMMVWLLIALLLLLLGYMSGEKGFNGYSAAAVFMLTAAFIRSVWVSARSVTASVSMTIVQDGPPKPVKESEPLIVGPESARRLIVVAIGWLLLALAAPAAVGFFRGFATGFVRGLTKGASQIEITPTLAHLLTTVGALGLGIVLLYASSIRGRIVGGGDRRLGLGVAPIARLPIIIGLSSVVVLYAALLDFAIYKYRPDLFFQSS